MTISISSVESQGRLREIKVWVANCGDAADISMGKLMVVINIRNDTGCHDVMLSHCAPGLGRRELAFNSKFELEVFSTFIT